MSDGIITGSHYIKLHNTNRQRRDDAGKGRFLAQLSFPRSSIPDRRNAYSRDIEGRQNLVIVFRDQRLFIRDREAFLHVVHAGTCHTSPIDAIGARKETRLNRPGNRTPVRVRTFHYGEL